MLQKKEILIRLMQEGRAKGCTIIGNPTEELRKAYFERQDLTKIIKEKGIKINEFEFDRTDVGIYFPQLGNDIIVDICTINFTRALSREEVEKACSFFTEIYDYYQASLPGRIINQICGMYKEEPFTMSDIFMLIKDNQSEIARKIGKNRQVISDISTTKCRPTAEIIGLLMKEYPLLPYDTYLLDLNK